MAGINLRKEGKVKSYFTVEPSLITVEDGFNVRIETPELLAHIAWLKESIIEHGVLKPVTVRKVGGRYVLTDGHQRHRAVLELVADKVDVRLPVIVEDIRTRSDSDRIAALMVENSGLPLTIPEQSEVVKRLLKFGLSVKEVAQKISKSLGHVNHLYKYLELPEEVKEMVVDGKVSPSAAIKTAFEEGDDVTEVLKSAEEEANSVGKEKVTNKDIVKAKDKKKSGSIVTTTRKVTTINQPLNSHTLFAAAYKYAASLIGTNDHLANAITDDCVALQRDIEDYEKSIKPPEDTEED